MTDFVYPADMTQDFLSEAELDEMIEATRPPAAEAATKYSPDQPREPAGDLPEPEPTAAKPTLHLTPSGILTIEDLARMCRAMTGKDPTPGGSRKGGRGSGPHPGGECPEPNHPAGILRNFWMGRKKQRRSGSPSNWDTTNGRRAW